MNKITSTIISHWRSLIPILFWYFSTWIKEVPFLSQVNSIFISTILIGYFILKSINLNIKKSDITFSLSVTISLLILIVIGLGLNQSALLIQFPLQKKYIDIVLSTILPIIWVTYSVKSKHTSTSAISSLTIKKIFIYLLPITNIILSFTGALILNNNGTNHLAVLSLILTGAIFLIIIIFERKLPESYISFALYCSSLSLLFSYSMRSDYLIGWDIHQEYKVFQITKQNKIWEIMNYRNAYNATLSITILPTVMSWLTSISDIYIFKFLYPIVFSVSPIFVYRISRNYLERIPSYLAAFFFIGQFQFMQQLPALNRQAISFIFFTALLYILLLQDVSRIKKRLLFIICSFGVVVSHYSTSYITAFMLITTYCLTCAYDFINFIAKKRFSSPLPTLNKNLTIGMIMLFCIFTVFWYGIYTESTGNIDHIFSKIVNNMIALNFEEGKTDQAKYALWGSSKNPTQNDVVNYQKTINEKYIESYTWVRQFPVEITQKYPVFLVPSKSIPIPYPFIYKMSQFGYEIVKKALKLFLIIGFLILLTSLIKKSKTFNNLDHIFLSTSAVLLLLIITLAPVLSSQYNFERLYEQMLSLLGILIVTGIYSIPFVNLRSKTIVACLLILVYFYNQNGMTNQLLGGLPYLNLNNYGEDYDRFYTKKSELASVNWLNKYSPKISVISLDSYARLEFQSQTNRNTGYLFDLVPIVLPEDGYVYGSFTNIKEGIARTNYQNKVIQYNFPTKFLNENKSLIYNNSETEIFK